MLDGSRLALSFDPESILLRLGASGHDGLLQIANDTPDADLASLKQQLSMHLPRLSVDENWSPTVVLAEAQRLAARLHALRRDHRPVLLPPSELPLLQSAQVEQIEPAVAATVFDRYHYLLSHRWDSFSVGLHFGPRACWPFIVASLSPFDLANMADGLPTLEGPGTLTVLSRLFAFPGAPRNSVSYFLGQLRSYLTRTRPELGFLVTYVNPNVGFHGASYRADNWQVLGYETGTSYCYVDQDYRTDRQLAQEYGTADPEALSCTLGRRFRRSCHNLKPLLVLARSLHNQPNAPGAPSVFPRWSPT